MAYVGELLSESDCRNKAEAARESENQVHECGILHRPQAKHRLWSVECQRAMIIDFENSGVLNPHPPFNWVFNWNYDGPGEGEMEEFF